MSETGASARAQLIKTRRGTWIDKSLLPAARRECLNLLREAAHEAVGMEMKDIPAFLYYLADIVDGKADELSFDKLHSGDLSPVRDTEIYNLTLDSLDRRGVLDSIVEHDILSGPAEELAARWRATLAVCEGAKMCGCCGRKLAAEEHICFGAKVYVGMQPLFWDYVSKPKMCKPHYMRTVLCESCAPELLSPERDDTITQLCAHCERPMVYRLTPSELGRTFCSDVCGRAYYNQQRKERRAAECEKVCEICEEKFTATRKDAKTCSRKCKQRAYRRREKEVKQDK
ncbi:MAG: hypothetical protein LC751_21860 [Actinobacteria bacterium]|nr:hypothetical protein [Actinomycetota bacterium]